MLASVVDIHQVLAMLFQTINKAIPTFWKWFVYRDKAVLNSHILASCWPGLANA
jgi:hypothetical protein